MILTGHSQKHATILTGHSHVKENIDGHSLDKRIGRRPGAGCRPPGALASALTPRRGLFYRKEFRGRGENDCRGSQDHQDEPTSELPPRTNFGGRMAADHDIKFCRRGCDVRQISCQLRKQLKAAFTLLAKHVVDPQARGCPMANAAVELTDKDHPARKGLRRTRPNCAHGLPKCAPGSGHASLAYWPTSCFSSWKERRSAPRFWAHAVQQGTLIAPPNR